MTQASDDETIHEPFDALTFAFGDPRTELYGLARLGVRDGAALGMALVYAGHVPVAGGRQVSVALPDDASWESVSAAGVRTAVDAPLKAWTVSYNDGADAGFDLHFEAISSPARVEAGGLQGYEQLCSVGGTVRHGGRKVDLRCLGQRGHVWGAPELDRIDVARVLSAWLGADRAVTLTAVRPRRAKRHHLDEVVAGWLIEGGAPRAISDPRLSTTYDGQLRQQRAGLELWFEGGDDDAPAIERRAAGEVVAGTTIDLGELRLDTAFFTWRMEGREGVGLYDVLRRSDGGASKR